MISDGLRFVMTVMCFLLFSKVSPNSGDFVGGGLRTTQRGSGGTDATGGSNVAGDPHAPMVWIHHFKTPCSIHVVSQTYFLDVILCMFGWVKTIKT